MRCSYSVRTIQLRKGGVLRGAAHSRDVRAQPRPHVALSPKGILLSLPHHTQITNKEKRETHKQRIQSEGKKRKENKRKEENSRKTPSKSINPILR